MNRNNKGFTLVEILIVVIILGILAAVVIPQFTEASNDARAAAMASDLQTVRSQVELYKVQHLEQTPDLNELGAADTPNFTARLTDKTDQDGKIDAAGVYGPYLHKFPTNPFISGDTADEVTFGVVACPGDGASGWYFRTDTGKFSPNDSDHKDD